MKPDYYLQATDLLNSHGRDMDVSSVLKVIPMKWSIGVISEYLCSSLRHHTHQARASLVKRSLFEERAKSLVLDKYVTEGVSFVVDPSTTCVICQKQFIGTEVFVRFPSGSISHLHCCKSVGQLSG